MGRKHIRNFDFDANECEFCTLGNEELWGSDISGLCFRNFLYIESRRKLKNHDK